MTNQKNVSKSNAITKKQSWFSTHSAQNIIGVISILGVVSIVSICYESFRIPSLTTKIESLNIQIKKKEKDISLLNNKIASLESESEIVKLTKENLEKGNLLKAKDSEILSLKSQIQEINKNRNGLEKQINDLNNIILQWNSWGNNIKKELNICKNNINIQEEINKLRKRIDNNNRRIADNSSFRPTDRELQSLFMDNQNLNNSILEYQKKLQCQEIK